MLWEEYSHESHHTVCMHGLCIRLKTKTAYIICNIVSHTAEETASVVKEMANTEFMLENRLDAIASDQGTNFVAAVRLLIEEGVGEEQVRCSCHRKFR